MGKENPNPNINSGPERGERIFWGGVRVVITTTGLAMAMTGAIQGEPASAAFGSLLLIGPEGFNKIVAKFGNEESGRDK